MINKCFGVSSSKNLRVKNDNIDLYCLLIDATYTISTRNVLLCGTTMWHKILYVGEKPSC